MNTEKIVRHMIFKCEYNSEDLYRCLENGRIYIRQPCDDSHVRWLSSIKWTGGYEADCPLKEGIVIKVVDNLGNEYFEEEIIKEEGYSDTVAKKAHLLWDEYISMVCDVKETAYNAKSYNEWKNWLLDYKELFGYNGYHENWVFCEADHRPRKTAEHLVYLGKELRITTEENKHRICKQTWTEIDIWDPKEQFIVGIIGFLFGDNEQKEIATEDVINFVHNGKSYSMTQEQIEAAHRYAQKQNRYVDAKEQYKLYVFGENPDSLDEEEYFAAFYRFRNEYGFYYPDGYKYIQDFVDRYEKYENCNIDENSIWEIVIREVLEEIKNNRK